MQVERERKGSGELRGAERRRRGWRERVVEWRRRSGEEERVAEERSGGASGRKVEGAERLEDRRWGGNFEREGVGAGQGSEEAEEGKEEGWEPREEGEN